MTRLTINLRDQLAIEVMKEAGCDKKIEKLKKQIDKKLITYMKDLVPFKITARLKPYLSTTKRIHVAKDEDSWYNSFYSTYVKVALVVPSSAEATIKYKKLPTDIKGMFKQLQKVKDARELLYNETQRLFNQYNTIKTLITDVPEASTLLDRISKKLTTKALPRKKGEATKNVKKYLKQAANKTQEK